MDERLMAREKFEKEIDSVIFRSTPKDVFAFLNEQQEKRIITLYAGTYSFDMATCMCKSDTKATFYFYLNGYNYGYSLSYFQGRFHLERDILIFSPKGSKRYSKKALSNRKADKRDMRSGEYYANKKSLIKNELSEGLIELIFTFVSFAIGAAVLALTGLSDCDADGELSVLIGGAVLVVIALAIFGIVKLFKGLKRKSRGDKNEKQR
ncbi:MAG: hypothetical protein J6A95_06875 [Clostridia bacterium]|nr:hypothetical protein [Clostridia bacterium]